MEICQGYEVQEIPSTTFGGQHLIDLSPPLVNRTLLARSRGEELL